jgi:putative ABC transport system permease protein
MTLVVRTATEPLTLAAAVQREIWARDKDQPVSNIQSLEQVVSQSLARRRFNLMVLGIFAFVALVLGAAGIYGVIAYAVHQRTQEIGIRMALGARQGDVFRLILKHGLLLALIGLGLGIAGSIALSRLLSSQLYDVSSIDPATFASVSLLLCGVALLACYIPARRATQVDPMVALRYE